MIDIEAEQLRTVGCHLAPRLVPAAASLHLLRLAMVAVVFFAVIASHQRRLAVFADALNAASVGAPFAPFFRIRSLPLLAATRFRLAWMFA